MSDDNTYIERKSWDDFRESGLFWWVNRIIHTFGWALVCEMNDDGTVNSCYPARCKFRGFSAQNEAEGFIKISKHMQAEADRLVEESQL